MKLDEAVMCFTQKIHVFGGLPSSLAYGAVGCEFNVNESTIYSILKEVSKRELLYIFVGNVKYCSYYLKIAFPYKIKHTVIYVQ